MSKTHYYLINHTIKEFCFFDGEKPILLIMDSIFKKYIHWKKEHDIRIGSEGMTNCDYINDIINNQLYIEIPFSL